jgi:glycosyltransferase involved in cell wall biosynthesis
MKILLDDGMQIVRGTGIGKYSEHLYKALSNFNNVEVSYSNYHPKNDDRKIGRIEYLRHINSREFQKIAESFDLCIFTNYAMPFHKLKTTTAVTIHDLAVYDCPATFPKIYVPYGRGMIENSIRKADAIITVSDDMRMRIAKRYPEHAEKIRFAWPGLYDHIKMNNLDCEYDNPALRELTKTSFFLMVGTIEKRKNIEFVIDAFTGYLNHLGVDNGQFLVLAGRPGYGFNEIKKKAESSRWSSNIVFTGYVSDNDCGKLYRNARAIVFPSIYEGFGSIQLECMSIGVPLLLSDIPTNREVSEGYGEFFSLDNPSDLSDAMSRVHPIDSNQKNIAAKRLYKAQWNNVANCYLNAIREKY